MVGEKEERKTDQGEKKCKERGNMVNLREREERKSEGSKYKEERRKGS